MADSLQKASLHILSVSPAVAACLCLFSLSMFMMMMWCQSNVKIRHLKYSQSSAFPRAVASPADFG